MQENKAITNSILKKITVLKRSLTIDNINQKKVIKELVATYKRLLEYSPDTILYKKELNHYLQILQQSANYSLYQKILFDFYLFLTPLFLVYTYFFLFY